MESSVTVDSSSFWFKIEMIYPFLYTPCSIKRQHIAHCLGSWLHFLLPHLHSTDNTTQSHILLMCALQGCARCLAVALVDLLWMFPCVADCFLCLCCRSKKVTVPSNAISRVIGRGGCNINAIRETSGAHVEVEKSSKGSGDRVITIKWVRSIFEVFFMTFPFLYAIQHYGHEWVRVRLKKTCPFADISEKEKLAALVCENFGEGVKDVSCSR